MDQSPVTASDSALAADSNTAGNSVFRNANCITLHDLSLMRSSNRVSVSRMVSNVTGSDKYMSFID